ncbi:MAG: NCS2 family permease [Bacteroidaceae bacterium]|nr:NCS2 family permease [Bacteroidaceae bacterium]
MLKKLFGLNPNETTPRTEIMAGITTFLTMSYILAVNPSIFSGLMPEGAVFTATALAAIVGCVVMALWAKLPYGLAPGMGLNAFFVYTICGIMGYTWQFALTAVLIEGLIFIVLTLTNVREAIVNAIPLNLRYAIGSGIGLFIAFIGLQSSGLVVMQEGTLVTLGDVTSGSALLALIGLVITGVLYIMKVRGAMLIGILATTFIGIPMDVTPDITAIVDTPDSISPIFCQFEWDKVFTLDMLVVVFTLLFIDMFDTIGTLVGVSTKAGMVDEKGRVKNIKEAFMADAIATTAGACLGTSTTTTYVESAAGVAVGGRSGLTAFTVGICFAIAMFFSPLFLSIPAAATAPVLILVGLMMLEPITKIEFKDFSEAIPAFVCLIAMPMTYSISNGILLGIIAYAIINIICGKFRKLTATICILAVLFVMKFVFVNPGEDVEVVTPKNEVQNVFKSINNVKADNKKEQILAALNIWNVEDVDATYSMYIVAEQIFTKDSIAQTGGFDIADADISYDNLPVFVAKVNEVTKYVIPIIDNGLCNGYAAINEDGNTIYGIYKSHMNEEPSTVEETTETVEPTVTE